VVVIPDIGNSIHNIGFFLPHCVKTLNLEVEYMYHKWSLTICDGCFDTLKVQKCKVRQVTKDVVKSEV